MDYKAKISKQVLQVKGIIELSLVLLDDDRAKHERVIEEIADMEGVQSACLEEDKLTVIGDIDPVSLVRELKDYGLKVELVGSVNEEDLRMRAAMANRLMPDMAAVIYTLTEASRVAANTIVLPVSNDRPLLEEDWYGAEFLLIDNILFHELPDSPDSPNLISLQLQNNQDLMIIPSKFFHQIPLLQILDLSYTSIISLPESLPRLVSLKELIIRGCDLMMELSPLVGRLHNLEKLDLDQTRILELPETVGNLSKLKFLRVSFRKYQEQVIKEELQHNKYQEQVIKEELQHNKYQKQVMKEEMQHKPIIDPAILGNLLQLTMLSIDVDPDDERWDASAITMISMTLRRMRSLIYLSLYHPNMEAFYFLSPWDYGQLEGFNFTIGHHKDRLISRVPREVEELFRSWDKCFRLINGGDWEGSPFDVSLQEVSSFFLDSHVSARSLTDLRVQHMNRLKFCIVAECHDMGTIIDGNTMEFVNQSYGVSLNLEYLLVYYAKKLRSIWSCPGPNTNLSNLRILALHRCPILSVIFTPVLAESMYRLEELVIEDCPEITSIFISGDDEGSLRLSFEKPTYRLPNLKRMSLLFLPKLERISDRLLMAPMLGKLAIYYCRQLRNLSNIKTREKTLHIKGEATWWNALEQENQQVPNQIQFKEIEKKRDLMTQLVDDKFMVLEYQKRNNCAGGSPNYVSTDGDACRWKSSSKLSPVSPRSQGEILQSPNLKVFTFSDLEMATRNFRPDSVLGEGWSGSVFKGWIDENSFSAAKPGTGMVIAVKRLNAESIQDHNEWLAEVKYLGQLSHPHLVKLIGYCLEDDHRLLVYEFMPRGSLKNQLFKRGSNFQPIPWSPRLKVALGAAKGLAFLHSAGVDFIYRDFNSSNVLIDSNYIAKLSDFWLPKDGPIGEKIHVSTRIMRTYGYGYAAPEYLAIGRLTAKSNVYSFGVMLLEVLSGRRAVDRNRPSGEQNLVEWAKPYLANKRKMLRILDSSLEGQYTVKDAYKASTLALGCLSLQPRFRPTMSEVVKVLEELQQGKESERELNFSSIDDLSSEAV